jgi:two-component system CheB/CheR fusion protein
VPPSKDDLLLVLFESGAVVEQPEAQPPVQARRRLMAGSAPALQREISRLQHELAQTRESLQAVIEEHEATNEELRSANEESQSSNEELQSTNEELETAKEELQSTNEELATVNDELQNSNLEANRVNNDLNNLLGSVQIPIVMVDNELNVRRFTPGAQRFFSLIPSDIGRSLMDIKAKVEVPRLDERIREVIDTLHLSERVVQDAEGRWCALRIRPYRTKDNKIDGAVLALVDIDELKRGLEQFSDMLWEPFLTLTRDLRVVRANEVFYHKFHVRREETEGQLLRELGNGQWDIPRLRKLLEEILPVRGRIKDFAVDHTFPHLGPRKMLLNARELETGSGDQKLILLAIRDVTATRTKTISL